MIRGNFLEDFVDIKIKSKIEKENEGRNGQPIRKSSFVAYGNGQLDDATASVDCGESTTL